MSDNYWNHDNLPKVGQMVLTSNGQEAEYRTMYEDQVCLHSETHGLVIHTLSSIKPIPDRKEASRLDVTFELSRLILLADPDNCWVIAEAVYDAGFRKVKPLPVDWYGMCMNGDISINEYLIENGYCIGEDE